MEFKTKIIINAPSKIVFNIITKADNFVLFDPNCIKIDGEICLGKKLSVYSRLSPNRVFKIRVSELVPGSRMVWESALPFNLFKGVRTFTVLAKDDHTTEFSVNEIFSGHLLFLFKKAVPDMTDAFNLLAKGLKKHIESR